MEPDIDELLQEFEEKYLSAEKRKLNKVINKSKDSSSSRSECADIDDILKTDSDSLPPAVNNTDHFFHSEERVEKCYPVFIGGSDMYNGVSEFGYKKICSSLHCTTCDFKVYKYTNYVWKGDTDYLFLRSNMPNIESIQSQLITKYGYNAFACQCTCFSTHMVIDLMDEKTLSWICRGHVRSPRI